MSKKSETPSQASRQSVFIMRTEGQSWEDFKKAVIESFRKAGLLTEGPRPKPQEPEKKED